MSAVQVRQAVPGDAETIAAFARALSLEEGHPAPALQAEHVRQEGFGAGARFRALLAERDGQPIGYALFYRAYATEHGERGLYLQDLYVVPEARRQGTGRTLMAAVARACTADRGCYVFWNARPRNRAALAFYRALGARKEPTVTLSLQPDALHRLAELADPMPDGRPGGGERSGRGEPAVRKRGAGKGR